MSDIGLLYRARRRPPHRHFGPLNHTLQPDGAVVVTYSCCGKVWDEVKAKQGRTSLRAGKDAERHIAKAYSGKRTGQFGGPDDVIVGELFVVQSKAGGWFSERYWNELVKLPRSGGRIPTLIVSERPKPGVHARRMVIRMMNDDVALHGEKP